MLRGPTVSCFTWWTKLEPISRIIRTFVYLTLLNENRSLAQRAVSDATISCFCSQALTFGFVRTTYVPSATKRTAIVHIGCSYTACVPPRAFLVRMFDLRLARTSPLMAFACHSDLQKRTCKFYIKKVVLCQYRGSTVLLGVENKMAQIKAKNFAPRLGFEPRTSSLTARRSTS